jgi:transposase
VIKFLWLQKLRGKAIHAQLLATLGGQAVSLSIVQRWIHRFRAGDTSCEDAKRPGKPMLMMGDSFRTFLERYPFGSAKIMSEHFDVSRATVTKILSRELRLRKYTRRWVPHLLDDAQKNHQILAAIEMLALLREREEVEFDGLVTGDQFWFIYHYEPRAIFVPAREKVPPYVRTQLRVQKVMITVFVTMKMLSVLVPLPKRAPVNQDFSLIRCCQGCLQGNGDLPNEIHALNLWFTWTIPRVITGRRSRINSTVFTSSGLHIHRTLRT